MPRRAGAEDADAIADVLHAARAEMTYLPDLHTEDDTRRFVRDVVLEELETWVSDDVLAFAALSDDKLEHLYVHPSAQGQGLGTELLGLAKARRPEGFQLWVFQKNEGARRFYERHGLTLLELTDGATNEEREPDALYGWSPRT